MMQLSGRSYKGGVNAREFRGPAPGSVAIENQDCYTVTRCKIAKNPKKGPVDSLILQNRDKSYELEVFAKQTREQAYIDLKNTWDRETEKKLMASSVRRKVNSMMAAHETTVEHRRDRLREILRAEEEQYLQEMEEKQETVLERQAKMRERAKFLKEKREIERLQFVEKKLDERWRSQCEELRSTMSKRTQDEVSAELVFQMQDKMERQKNAQENEKMYAELWEADMMAKAAREEKEAIQRHAKNKETLAVLQTQMAALEQRKEEEKLLIAEQAQLLKEQAAIRKLEEEKAEEEKRRRQLEAKKLYETNLRLKLKKQAREEQEQLAFDMKVLETLLQETENEAMEMVQRKKELREENLRYMTYLKQLAEEEKKQQAEMEAIIDAEVEKNWQKRLAQWRLEREARKKMLEEVMAERNRQIRERLLENEKMQREALIERERIRQIIEENKLVEAKQKAKIKQNGLQYQQDLSDQMAYNFRIQSAKTDEQNHEFIFGQQAEAEYQQKLRQCLDEPHGDPKMHPIRKHYYRNRQLNA